MGLMLFAALCASGLPPTGLPICLLGHHGHGAVQNSWHAEDQGSTPADKGRLNHDVVKLSHAVEGLASKYFSMELGRACLRQLWNAI